MKCPMCDGTGKSGIGVGAFIIHGADCDRCNGKGIIEPLTNEEYIRTCSTEELAELIYKIAVTDVLMDRFFNAEIIDGDSGIKEAETWLKEKHHE